METSSQKEDSSYSENIIGAGEGKNNLTKLMQFGAKSK
jgi:hypothetical protein